MTESELLKRMGERIYCRRKLPGYTQEVLVERMDVSVQMISNLELGKKAIRPGNLVKLSEVLGVSTDYILKGNDEAEQSPQLKKLELLQNEDLELVTKIIELCINKNK